jgi:hypothetical protein
MRGGSNVTTVTLTEYIAATGGPYTDKQAAVIGPELERLADTGHSTAKDILEAARPKRSKLHPFFDWDDEAAAEKWRLHSARVMAANIHIRVVGADGDERTTRAFHPVRVTENEEDGKQRPYTSIAAIMADPDLSGQLLDRAKRDLGTFRRKYAVLSELQGVFAAIDELSLEEAA